MQGLGKCPVSTLGSYLRNCDFNRFRPLKFCRKDIYRVTFVLMDIYSLLNHKIYSNPTF